MTTRFNNAINALTKAYFNDTLFNGTCIACAVGNMIAHCNNIKLTYHDQFSDYEKFSYTRGQNWLQLIEDTPFKFDVWNTGYNSIELKKIESAFEGVYGMFDYEERNENIDKITFKALMAVVDVLCTLEGINNSTEYKELFNKNKALEAVI